MYILTINPGSTSTKVALFDDVTEIARVTLRHSNDELEVFEKVSDQLEFRLATVKSFLSKHATVLEDIVAVVGRGGLLRPIPGGTYQVNEKMLLDLSNGVQGEHASNLGGLLARKLADELNVPAYIVDPVAVDEFDEIARISGTPQIERRSLSHALNIKAVAHRFAEDIETDLARTNIIVAHLGGGISVAPLYHGRIIDVNNANEMGPFSPERSGGLPVGDVVKMCFSGEYSSARELKKVFNGKSGLVAYLGTNDMRQVEALIDKGNQKARLIWEAMAYQVSKEIGSMATVLKGSLDAIVLTGGLAYSDAFTSEITSYVDFLAPVYIYPGEDELQALAEGALRVLTAKEKALIY